MVIGKFKSVTGIQIDIIEFKTLYILFITMIYHYVIIFNNIFSLCYFGG